MSDEEQFVCVPPTEDIRCDGFVLGCEVNGDGEIELETNPWEICGGASVFVGRDDAAALIKHLQGVFQL